MPPTLPRPSVSGLQAAFSSCSLRTTTKAITASTSAPASSIWGTRRRSIPSSFNLPRCASTSADKPYTPRASPPESPNFIQIPKTVQPNVDRRPKLKGHLPIPRQVFTNRDGDRKIQPSHFELTVPVSAAEKAGLPPKSVNDAKRRLLAASRREALTSGLKGLWRRKEQREARALRRNTARRAANRKAALAPERSDDLLTRGTVRAATALTTAVLPDPERFRKAEAAAKRHAEKMALKAEERRDALARLYVAAGDFIVDEKELEERVNKIFTSDHFKAHYMSSSANIWELHSHPVSVAELKAEIMNTATNQGYSYGSKSDLGKSTARQKAVAEELTGGKL